MTKSESNYLNCQNDNCELFACVARREAEAMIAELEREVARMRKALEFYADWGNWFEGDYGEECRSICRSDLSELSPRNCGGGKRAREALGGPNAEAGK